MADRVRKVKYCHVKVSSRPGQGIKILSAIQDAGINLYGFSGFPEKNRKSQLDFITDEISDIRRLAREEGWHVSKTKKGFLIQGTDKIGAVTRHVEKLADRNINIIAAEGIAAGKGRYGMILWVKPKDYARAARALRAK